ncbi:MAG: hypothetical protein LBI06_00900 [Treponema sp.]|jgi:hypothetical protein|nr:hypothetical protein [Treponema sp.]
MNIEAVPYHAFPTIGYAISAAQTGKASLPVSPSSAIYAHFEHISGVPAPEGVQGVNINKLKIIDTLIGQLSRIRSENEALAMNTEMDEEKRMNALFEQFQSELQRIQASSANNPYAVLAPVTGAIFNISV